MLKFALRPQAGLLADFALVCVGAGLIAGAAQIRIPLPFTPVPLTGQTFAVLLVSAGLGAVRAGRRAHSSSCCLGLQDSASMQVAPTAGRRSAARPAGIWSASWQPRAIVGLSAEQRWDSYFSSALGVMLTGSLVIYLVGLPWLAAMVDANLEKTLEHGLGPFVPGDMLKLCLAAALLSVSWRLVRHKDY